MEATPGLWSSSYMVMEKGISPESAAKWASLFYFGITFGRFLGSRPHPGWNGLRSNIPLYASRNPKEFRQGTVPGHYGNPDGMCRSSRRNSRTGEPERKDHLSIVGGPAYESDFNQHYS